MYHKMQLQYLTARDSKKDEYTNKTYSPTEQELYIIGLHIIHYPIIVPREKNYDSTKVLLETVQIKERILRTGTV